MLETRFVSVDRQEVSLNLKLEQARADSAVVAVLDQELGIDLEMLDEKIAFLQRRIQGLREAHPGLEKDLAQLDQVIAEVVRRGEGTVGPGGHSRLGPARGRPGRGRCAGTAWAICACACSSACAPARPSRTAWPTSWAWPVSSPSARASSGRPRWPRACGKSSSAFGDLELERDYVLPVKRREVRTDISSKQVQLGSLTSLQQVGKTIVSDKPVRPRGLRAAMILVFLGIMGGLVLGFSLDYLLAHRREIFRS